MKSLNKLRIRDGQPALVAALFGLTLAACDQGSDQSASAPETTSPPDVMEKMEETAEDAAAVLMPGPDAQEQIQEALIVAEPGDTVMLGAGVFELTDVLSLDVDDVTLLGAGMDKTILSFKGQLAGGEGLLVTSDRTVLKDFSIEDPKGDGIKAKGVDTISFLNVRAAWTQGLKDTNGAYGLYPVQSKNVLIDGSVAFGASDAGIYVGQSQNIIVRNSTAEYNVAGIEIENSYDADVYNNTAQHNSTGILVFDMPNLPQMGSRSIRVYQNKVINNDTDNFSPPGGIVNIAPKGAGILVFSSRDVHIFENEVGNNQTSNILLVGYPVPYEDPNMNPLVREIYVYNNTLGKAGWAPNGPLAEEGAKALGGQFPSILWDGAHSYMRDGETVSEEAVVVIRGNTGETSFLNLGLTNVGLNFMEAQPSPELPGVDVEIPAYDPVVLPQDS